MNILIVSQFYNPEQFLINEIAPELVKRGHSVTVLTGLPNYPQGRVYPEYRFRNRRSEIIDGVKVIRCFETGRRDSSFSLALNYISYAVSASLKALSTSEEYDVVFCYQLYAVTMGLPRIVYKFRKNVKIDIY